MSEWCECIGGGPYTYFGLSPTGLDGTQSWVHSACGKPSFPVWEKHEKYCDECGRSFSSPYSDLCEYCSPENYLVSWKTALDLTAAARPFGMAAGIVEKIVV